jgi:SAM-dependent methyltransferase
MRLLDRALASSGVYEFSRRAIGAREEMRRLVDDVVRPEPGMRVLDLGCGNGRLVPYLNGAFYVGVDNNSSYVEAATSRWGSESARFVVSDLVGLADLDLGPVDAAVLLGVLHHLPDQVASAALQAAGELLAPGGRLITMDPCFEPTQRSIARVLMALDRGRYVRHPADYVRLIDAHLEDVKSEIWTDVYRFPYTHLITESHR